MFSPAKVLKKFNEDTEISQDNVSKIKVGRTVEVDYEIKDARGSRVQKFKGLVISVKNAGISSNFTVRKVSNGVGVEKRIKTYSPFIKNITVTAEGVVRRAKIYYIRTRIGKSARLKVKIQKKAK